MIIFLRILSILILVSISYLCYELKDYKLIIFTCCGFITGVLFTLSYVLDVARKLKVYKREFEKNSINSDESASKVKVLESKIEVLEKALQDALNNNSKNDL